MYPASCGGDVLCSYASFSTTRVARSFWRDDFGHRHRRCGRGVDDRCLLGEDYDDVGFGGRDDNRG